MFMLSFTLPLTQVKAVWRGFYETYKGRAAVIIQAYWRCGPVSSQTLFGLHLEHTSFLCSLLPCPGACQPACTPLQCLYGMRPDAQRCHGTCTSTLLVGDQICRSNHMCRGYMVRKLLRAQRHGKLLIGFHKKHPHVRDTAARLIQKCWRGFLARRCAALAGLGLWPSIHGRADQLELETGQPKG